MKLVEEVVKVLVLMLIVLMGGWGGHGSVGRLTVPENGRLVFLGFVAGNVPWLEFRSLSSVELSVQSLNSMLTSLTAAALAAL